MGQSGVLLHISSLASPGGIGTLGREAYGFVDFLSAAGCALWQVLPIGPTGFGDSPYQSPCAFAGNPYFIDLRLLAEEGLLEGSDIPGGDGGPVDFARLYAERPRLLKKAFLRGYASMEGEIGRFEAHAPWLADYALFMALKARFHGAPYGAWPGAARLRKPPALKRYGVKLQGEIDFHRFVQYIFFRQWGALKAYANQKGVLLMGDLPLYAGADSADVWASPEDYLLGRSGRPDPVAGVPPDRFSRDGQLWGNPIYDWERMQSQGFPWWKARFRHMAALFDLVRIDHFIGVAEYYAIPAGSTTARAGEWRKGPGMALVAAAREAAPGLRIVAEDLGVPSRRAKDLLGEAGYPGMAVVQFALDGNADNPHLPQNVRPNAFLYTGTHDNETLSGWWANLDERGRAGVLRALGLDPGPDPVGRVIDAVYASRAQTVIVPMQDHLRLGNDARMNTPGTMGSNWRWRMAEGALTDELLECVLALNARHGRLRGN